MILYIDTTGKESVELAAVTADQVIRQRYKDLLSAENFGITVKQFLRRHSIELSDLQKVAVRTGSGYFSRIRTGVVFANALAYTLKVDIVTVGDLPEYATVTKAKGKGMIQPVYGAEPRITQSKKKYGFKN